jgi:hypothetical protein
MSGARRRPSAAHAIEVVDAPEAAHLVDDLATDAENPAVATERLLIALDVDGTVLLEDETLSPGVVRRSRTRIAPDTR